MSTSISIINLHTFTFLILLFIYANHAGISANSIHRRSLMSDDDDQSNILSYDSLNDDVPSSNLGPRTHRPSYIPAMPRFDLRSGVVRFIPYKKRTIPLELQKALYAHGIVGRRR